MAPRPKVCTGNTAIAVAAVDATMGVSLLFLFVEASLHFLAEVLNIAATKGWGARLRKKARVLWLLHR